MIHRSLLFAAIQEQKNDPNLDLEEILVLLKAREKTALDTGESGKDTDFEKVSKILTILGKLEDVHAEHTESLNEATKQSRILESRK